MRRTLRTLNTGEVAMHTCDGCFYNLPGGGCSREYYPSYDQSGTKTSDERGKSKEGNGGRWSKIKRMISMIMPWNWKGLKRDE